MSKIIKLFVIAMITIINIQPVNGMKIGSNVNRTFNEKRYLIGEVFVEEANYIEEGVVVKSRIEYFPNNKYILIVNKNGNIEKYSGEMDYIERSESTPSLVQPMANGYYDRYVGTNTFNHYIGGFSIGMSTASLALAIIAKIKKMPWVEALSFATSLISSATFVSYTGSGIWFKTEVDTYEQLAMDLNGNLYFVGWYWMNCVSKGYFHADYSGSPIYEYYDFTNTTPGGP